MRALHHPNVFRQFLLVLVPTGILLWLMLSQLEHLLHHRRETDTPAAPVGPQGAFVFPCSVSELELELVSSKLIKTPPKRLLPPGPEDLCTVIHAVQSHPLTSDS